jgi:transcriptional regulator with XRE-family HTH domain
MIGSQVRQLRRKRNLTTTRLADLVGVSKSMISQIEHGNANPSIGTARSIATALEVPLFALFLDPDGEREGQSTVVRKDERITLLVPGSDAVRELLVPDLNRAMTVGIARIPPGASSSPVPTTHLGEECVFVLKGTVSVDVCDQSYTLCAGDALYFDAQLPHVCENVGDCEAELLSAIAPPTH